MSAGNPASSFRTHGIVKPPLLSSTCVFPGLFLSLLPVLSPCRRSPSIALAMALKEFRFFILRSRRNLCRLPSPTDRLTSAHGAFFLAVCSRMPQILDDAQFQARRSLLPPTVYPARYDLHQRDVASVIIHQRVCHSIRRGSVFLRLFHAPWMRTFLNIPCF